MFAKLSKSVDFQNLVKILDFKNMVICKVFIIGKKKLAIRETFEMAKFFSSDSSDEKFESSNLRKDLSPFSYKIGDKMWLLCRRLLVKLRHRHRRKSLKRQMFPNVPLMLQSMTADMNYLVYKLRLSMWFL